MKSLFGLIVPAGWESIKAGKHGSKRQAWLSSKLKVGQGLFPVSLQHSTPAPNSTTHQGPNTWTHSNHQIQQNQLEFWQRWFKSQTDSVNSLLCASVSSSANWGWRWLSVCRSCETSWDELCSQCQEICWVLTQERRGKEAWEIWFQAGVKPVLPLRLSQYLLLCSPSHSQGSVKESSQKDSAPPTDSCDWF